jgi:hypothetical protein
MDIDLVRASRFGQRISVPILMAPYLHPKIAFFTCLIPGISVYAFDRFYLVPKRREARAK